MQIMQALKRFVTADIMSFVYGAVALSAVIGFIPHLPQVAVYLIMIIFAFYNITKTTSINQWLVVFLLYIPIELMLSRPDPMFRSWSRYILFVILLLCVSPLLNGVYLKKNRRRIFMMVLWVCAFLGVGSFLGKFIGLNFMPASRSDLVNKVGLFGGLTTHSMLLGPIAGIGAIFMTYQAMTLKKRIYWLLMAFCLFSVMFSSSRSSLISSLAGIIITIYKLSGNEGRFIKIMVIVAVVSLLTFSLWGGAMDGIIAKNGGDTSTLNLDSRLGKWEARLAEFIMSPVFGVGFAAVDLNTAFLEELNIENGGVEAGTSWLIIFSMLGILGAIILIPFLIMSYIQIWKQKDSFDAIVCGVLTLLFIHMVAEGYIFSGGSFLCFLLWLTIGVANDSKYRM